MVHLAQTKEINKCKYWGLLTTKCQFNITRSKVEAKLREPSTLGWHMGC
jgi:hypothetical protein